MYFYSYIVFFFGNIKAKMEVKLTDDNIGGLPAELAHDPLKAGLLADLGGAVHVLNWEERTEAKEENLGEGGHQLGLGGDREYLMLLSN